MSYGKIRVSYLEEVYYSNVPEFEGIPIGCIDKIYPKEGWPIGEKDPMRWVAYDNEFNRLGPYFKTKTKAKEYLRKSITTNRDFREIILKQIDCSIEITKWFIESFRSDGEPVQKLEFRLKKLVQMRRKIQQYTDK